MHDLTVLSCPKKPLGERRKAASSGKVGQLTRHAILAASTALALIAVPAVAQDFSIDGTFVNPDATNGSFADTEFDVNGASVLMTEGSSIDVSDAAGDNAIQANGDNITIEVRGALSTQGTNAAQQGIGIIVLGDDAVFILTETGTITTVGTRAYGQFIRGTGGRIENAGTIITGGAQGVGQYIYDHLGLNPVSFILNTGTIMTAGDSAYGQYMRDDGSTITNTGMVMTTGDGADAQIISGDDGTITNTGTLITRGDNADGQLIFDDGGTITNTGTINIEGRSSRGQNIFADSGTITNAGTITTGGGDAYGQYIFGDDGTITNTGVIETGSVGSFGQFLNGSNGTITNSGRLVSRQAAAIRIDDSEDNNTVNLLAPGFIGGAIDFSDDPGNGGGPPTNTTVNIVTGLSHSIFWTLEGDMVGGAPNISGAVPWFYNAATQSVATFDPTLLTSQSDALGDLTSLLSRAGLGAVQGFGASSRSDTGFSALGFMPVDDGAAVAQRLGRVWATVLGGQMDHEGGATTLDSTIGHLGLAGGFTWQHTPSTTLSAMAGYIAGSNEADVTWSPSFDHDTHTLFASLHGEHQLDWAALQFGVTAGYSHVDHNRFVNDNLALLGESWVSADYGGFFVSPELALSTDIVLESGQTLTPNAGLRYAVQWLGGYSETGAISPAANATVENRFVGTLEARAGLDVTRSFAFGTRTGTLTGRIGYLGRWSTGDDGTGITLNGVTQTVTSDAQDLNALTVGATLRSDLGETAFLELDANYLLGDTAQGFDGRITVGIAF